MCRSSCPGGCRRPSRSRPPCSGRDHVRPGSSLGLGSAPPGSVNVATACAGEGRAFDRADRHRRALHDRRVGHGDSGGLGCPSGPSPVSVTLTVTGLGPFFAVGVTSRAQRPLGRDAERPVRAVSPVHVTVHGPGAGHVGERAEVERLGGPFDGSLVARRPHSGRCRRDTDRRWRLLQAEEGLVTRFQAVSYVSEKCTIPDFRSPLMLLNDVPGPRSRSGQKGPPGAPGSPLVGFGEMPMPSPSNPKIVVVAVRGRNVSVTPNSPG